MSPQKRKLDEIQKNLKDAIDQHNCLVQQLQLLDVKRRMLLNDCKRSYFCIKKMQVDSGLPSDVIRCKTNDNHEDETETPTVILEDSNMNDISVLTDDDNM